jgi:hypothetical protein
MMVMVKNQKGFVLILTGLLIVFAIGCLGLAGYYVISNNRKMHSTKNQTNEVQATEPVTTNGLKRYENVNAGISFDYPEKWTIDDGGGAISGIKSYNIKIASDDKKINTLLTFIRVRDGRFVHNSLDEWQAYAKKSGIKYKDLVQIESKYQAYRYIDTSTANSNITNYELFAPNSEVSLNVLGPTTSEPVISKDVDKLVGSIAIN